MTPDTLGCRVRRFRFRKGWTLKQLAQEAQLSKSFLSTIENGKSQPTGRVLLRLANALETSVDFLIQGSQVKETQPYSELELRIARLEYEVGIRRGGAAAVEWHRQIWGDDA